VGGAERGRRSRPSVAEPRAALAAKHIQACYAMLFAPPEVHYDLKVAQSNKKPATKPDGMDAARFAFFHLLFSLQIH
jgi:hypothetical protein